MSPADPEPIESLRLKWLKAAAVLDAEIAKAVETTRAVVIQPQNRSLREAVTEIVEAERKYLSALANRFDECARHVHGGRMH